MFSGQTDTMEKDFIYYCRFCKLSLDIERRELRMSQAPFWKMSLFPRSWLERAVTHVAFTALQEKQSPFLQSRIDVAPHTKKCHVLLAGSLSNGYN